MTAPSSRRVTIVEVAQHAGVSTAAVSKVLRNAYGVSAAMQERVRSSIAELGYRPHAAARGMRGQTYTIGVLMDSIRNPFFADIIDGIHSRLADTDYQVLLGAGGYSATAQSHLADAMVDRRMDGVILIAPAMTKVDVVRTAMTTPTVVIGYHDVGRHFDTVAHDEHTGAELVVEHLVALGHRRIAHSSTAGAPGSRWTRRPEVVLAEGFRDAMAARHLAEQATVRSSSWSRLDGYEVALQLLSADPRPTAVLAWTDAAALGVFAAAEELGLRIPADLSLVGYNNTSVAASPPILLTSVDQGGAEMGAAAARMLLERIEGRTRPMQVITAPTLITRRTTAPPPGA
jgi:LacI family transcriptional regulator, galactose operon repressor